VSLRINPTYQWIQLGLSGLKVGCDKFCNQLLEDFQTPSELVMDQTKPLILTDLSNISSLGFKL